MESVSGLFLITLWITLNEGAVFISQNMTAWQDIGKICTVAVPEINYKASENGKKFLVDYSMEIEEREGVWVGYYLAATPFQYIGCSSIGEETATEEFSYITPGLCYSACNRRGVIGISLKKCYCLNGITGLNIYSTNCLHECSDQPHMSCGGNNLMSLYTFDNSDIKAPDKDDKEYCLRFEINSNMTMFLWGKCKTDIQTICMLNNAAKLTALKFGYLEKKGGKTELKFLKDKSTTRKILCSNDTVNNKITKDSNGSNTGVVVGVSVVVVTILVAAVIAFIILRRRGKLEGICITTEMYKKPLQRTRTQDISVVHNNTYQVPYDSPYNEINEADLQKVIGTTNDSNEDNGHYTHTYFELESQIADSKSKPDNVNSMQEEANTAYNTLNSNFNNRNNISNDYDTTEKAVHKVREQHVKTNGDMKGNNFDAIDDDAYNHTNDAATKNSRTDNVYGVPRGDEDDYGNVHRSNGSDINDDRNPYNHINA